MDFFGWKRSIVSKVIKVAVAGILVANNFAVSASGDDLAGAGINAETLQVQTPFGPIAGKIEHAPGEKLRPR